LTILAQAGMMYTMNKKKRLKIVKLGVDNTCSVLYNGTYKLKKDMRGLI